MNAVSHPYGYPPKGVTPLEVFDFYDGPRFYSIRDTVGRYFLVYWIDETETSSSWLYVAISPERYLGLKQGNVLVAEALSQPEDGTAFVVHGDEITLVQASEIKGDWLPSEDYRLERAHSPLPPKVISAVELSTKVHRQVLDLALSKPSNTHELAARNLGRVLEAIQSTVDALACGSNLSLRRIPEEIKNRSELMFTSVFESSFGIRLQSKGSDLFSNDETAAALETLGKLIVALSQPEFISKELHKFNILARSRFKHLLSVLVDSQVSLVADWGNPDGRNINAKATFEEISLSLAKLKGVNEATKQINDHRGRLVGVDIRSNFFALVDESDKIIRGELSPYLQAEKFSIPSEVIATIEETCEIDPLTDKERWTYLLLTMKFPPAQ